MFVEFTSDRIMEVQRQNSAPQPLRLLDALLSPLFQMRPSHLQRKTPATHTGHVPNHQFPINASAADLGHRPSFLLIWPQTRDRILVYHSQVSLSEATTTARANGSSRRIRESTRVRIAKRVERRAVQASHG
jgi:hypothetical protein